MLQAALDLQTEPLTYELNGRPVRRPTARVGSAFHPAPYGVYQTLDGYLALSLSPLTAVSRALGDPPALAPYLDPAVAYARREDIRRALDTSFARRSTAAWLETLRAHGVWCAPVHDYPAALDDPAVRHLDPVMEIEHPQAGTVRLLKHAIRYSSGAPQVRRVPPALGADTDSVLGELGFSAEEIAQLRTAAVV